LDAVIAPLRTTRKNHANRTGDHHRKRNQAVGARSRTLAQALMTPDPQMSQKFGTGSGSKRKYWLSGSFSSKTQYLRRPSHVVQLTFVHIAIALISIPHFVARSNNFGHSTVLVSIYKYIRKNQRKPFPLFRKLSHAGAPITARFVCIIYPGAFIGLYLYTR
jgi:hypothetical protein